MRFVRDRQNSSLDGKDNRTNETVIQEKTYERYIMSKYNALKFLKKTKARIPHVCESCAQEIRKGDIYYRESIGRVNAPGIQLRNFCMKCYEKHGENLLAG